MLAVGEVINQTSPQQTSLVTSGCQFFQNLMVVGEVRLKSEKTAPNLKNLTPLGININYGMHFAFISD